MPLPQVIDVSALIAAFPGDSPAGSDLSADPHNDPVEDLQYGPYDKLLDWHLRWSEAVQMGKSRPGPPESGGGAGTYTWSDVAGPCEQLLRERSKDLRVASLLAVALAYRDGVAGLRDGLRLIAGMLRAGLGAYELYPRPLTEGLKSVASVANTLENVVLTLSLSAGRGRSVSLLDHRIAEYLDDNPDSAERYVASGAMDKDAITQVLEDAGGEVLHGFQQTATECIEAVGELTDIADQLIDDAARRYDEFAEARRDSAPWSAFGSGLTPSRGAGMVAWIGRVSSYDDALRNASPDDLSRASVSIEALDAERAECKSLLSYLKQLEQRCKDVQGFMVLKETLDKCIRVVEPFVGEYVEVLADADGESPDAAGADADSASQAAPRQGAVDAGARVGPAASREDAVRMLKFAYDYFKKHEPHSVMPYILERAVKWSKLPLPDLLGAIFDNHGDVASTLLQRANIDISAGSDDDPTN